ncbi:NAD-glutamate dehydrogenase [Gordonia oryzae]|uniref:NAD-glutamate dehydrogenase n=1 Tax=Gordonia oryzae TaxID=2487349 RepID=A0A3N4G6A1_9ACTN|nr:NAD-glutamate dehydrogenase [Gordonia oryzae]
MPSYLATSVGGTADAADTDRSRVDPSTLDPAVLDRIRAHMEIAAVRRPGESVVEVSTDRSGGTEVVVVTDDMPLLVESVLAALEGRGMTVTRIDHPIMAVTRDEAGALTDICGPHAGLAESWISVSALSSRESADDAQLRYDIRRGIDVVAVIDGDATAMRARLTECSVERAGAYLGEESGASADVQREYARLLEWFAGNHFVPLGYARLDPSGAVTDRLGLNRAGSVDLDFPIIDSSPLTPRVSRVFLDTGIQRSKFPILIAVPAFDAAGAHVGEHRFLGVFTSSGLHQTVLDVPVLRGKVHEVVALAGVDEDSFAGRTMVELLQNYPLVEMFQDTTAELHRRIDEMLDAVATRSLRVFLRVHPAGAAATALIYLPRDRYNTASRTALGTAVTAMLEGSDLEYSARVSERPLALLQVMVRVDPDLARTWGSVDIGADVQRRMQITLSEAIRSWDERVRELITTTATERALPPGGADAMLRLISTLPADYKDRRVPADAVGDLAHVAGLEPGHLAVTFAKHSGALSRTDRDPWDFTLYLCDESATLTDVLPVLHSLGLDVIDEHPYALRGIGDTNCHVYEFAVVLTAGIDVDVDHADDLPERFTEAFAQIWRQHAQIDAYNELIIRCGLDWRAAAMLRAYGRYLKQCGFSYSTSHVASTLGRYREVTRGLVALFETSFDPAVADASRRADVLEQLRSDVGAVLSLDADRIVSAFLAVIAATDRTNFYVLGAPGNSSDSTDSDSTDSDSTNSDDEHRPVMSFKLRPRDIPQTPEPRPLHEIFVYSPRVEGVHLRFGAVARGGLRWSDRREDFRTEILGLVKAQAVKNAVIVPVGAKGGFVLTRPPAPTGDAAADREALRAEGIDCYRMFISGLLDVTDNIDRATGEVIAARSVVRRDGDDPYLVVAADKGTAAFSDIANDVAERYGFWLGDAFASGGSAGYDHKAMGITARGAWESVKRHFREMGIDTQTKDFTVVGIGDMSGDVFGNGMLLSEHIRLVAAFDHRHIFVDPTPDAASSYAERARMFALPRSSWADYDERMISPGGGVWSRERKSIPIGPEMRTALGLSGDVIALSPPELIRAVLLAPVDLLWNGGIGTYIRASTESDADVADKANDAIRVAGDELRCKVIGEGGNLGVTERGRIEFDLAGGRVNTDAMDNSAGVDCSDHEVNIKILLDAAVSSGGLSPDDRNPLLESMTDEVARLVLADNISQNSELGFGRAYSRERVDVHVRLLAALAARGVNLTLEALPSPAALRKRFDSDTHRGLTSPELATLMAHVKLVAKDDLLAGDLPDNDVLDHRLIRYFPMPLQDRFAAEIHDHRLRREIVTTVLVNDVIDRAGITHLFRLGEATGATTEELVRAFVVAEQVFGMADLLDRIQSASASIDAVDEMMLYARRLLFRVSRWLLAFRPQPLPMAADITRYRERVADLTARLDGWFGPASARDVDARVRRYHSLGVAAELAHDVAVSLHRFCLLDIIDAAEIADRDPGEVGELYFGVMEHFGLEELLTAVSNLDYGDRWHALARLALRDDMHGALRALTLTILESSEPDEPCAEKISEWESAHSSRLARVRSMLAEIEAAGNIDLATLSVAARQLRSVIR